ncbi:hypothetical protein [Marinobacter sp. F3R11]|uniref:hypothetical protein n=1 Tax=Marinobacter sp. F3R11 TaxID=2267231 RepID=UPI000DEBCF14|nr:hypothetical protein [Marinobacter sp. F3R11]RBW48897.1 hypothetical protein DS878_12205 [Marinobacter sp. F3R11]
MSTEDEDKFKWKGVPMTSEAHLIDTSLFRRAVLIPVFLGVTLMIVAALNSSNKLTPCFEIECFGTFFNLFKFQFAVMGLAIPLGALVASHHRSMQSAAQIKTQLNQNIFSNYIDHKKLFEQFFRDNDPLRLNDIKNRQIWEIYDRVFPGAPYGDLLPNAALKPFMDKVAEQFNEIVEKTKSDLHEDSLALTTSSIPRLWVYANITVSNFLGLPRPVDAAAINRDPVNLLRSYADFTLAVANGLQDCANFHKFYDNYSALSQIESDYSDLKNDLESLQAVNDARCKILNAIGNATEASGELNRKDEYAARSFSNRLKEFTDEQNPRDYISPENARLVFENYIPESHRKVFLQHIPAAWQIELPKNTETTTKGD